MEGAAPLQGEIVTPIDMVYIAYARLGLDEQLEAYALTDGLGDESTVRYSLIQYGQDIAGIATEGGGDIDVGVIREAFDRLYEGMEGVARKKYGPEKPKTISEGVLTRSGLVLPRYRQQFSHLDDKYWDEQFMRQYETQEMVERLPDESDQDYLARYIATCLHGFPWAYFTNFI